jgi:hypothetical protein
MKKVCKILSSKVVIIFRKGTIATLCIVFILAGCSESEPAQPIQPTQIYDLENTSWKLEGFADTQTGEFTEAKPKCNKCYTLTFDTDSTASGYSVMNSLGLRFNPALKMWVATESYDLQIGTVAMFYEAMKSVESYTVENDSLRIFYNNNKNYLLYKAEDGEIDEDTGEDAGEYFQEIAIGSKNPVINYTTDGISFEFCLLNEQNKPSTVFNEGENFSFYFKITNKQNYSINKEIQISGQLLGDLVMGGFCRIISQDQQDIGYPFYDDVCLQVVQYFSFYGVNHTYGLIVPWVNNCERWGILLCGVNSFLGKGYLPREYLSCGKYYTVLDCEFLFRYGIERFSIPVLFKINFEVK